MGQEIDDYKSDLIVRFLTSAQLQEYDTPDQKIQSVFQIYGQSFDKVKKFIDNIYFLICKNTVTFQQIQSLAINPRRFFE